MSQALGTFEQNWTLDCVCDDCNKYFGDNFELPLGRDSLEAVLRVRLGVKPPEAADSILYRRLSLSLQAKGPFCGRAREYLINPMVGALRVQPHEHWPDHL